MSLSMVEFESSVLARSVSVNVCMPNYHEGDLPVVYLYHGLGGNRDSFVERTDIDRLASEYGLCVVMPDAGESWHVNDLRPGGLAWEDFLAGELVEYVEGALPVIGGRDASALAGFSMGGYGALLYGFRYLDRFAAVAALAPSVTFGHALRPDRPERDAFMLACAPPGGKSDLWVLAEEVADQKQIPAVRIDVGEYDHLLQYNREFHAILDDLGVGHHYREMPGGHDWDYVNSRLPGSLRFLSSHVG